MLIVFDLDDTLVDTSGGLLLRKLKDVFDILISSGFSGGMFNELVELNGCAENAEVAIRSFLEKYDYLKLLNLALVEYRNPPKDFEIDCVPGALELLNYLLEINSHLD